MKYILTYHDKESRDAHIDDAKDVQVNEHTLDEVEKQTYSNAKDIQTIKDVINNNSNNVDALVQLIRLILVRLDGVLKDEDYKQILEKMEELNR